MKLLRLTLITALRTLARNKLRSALTILGIVIGVAAVITMVALGQGASAAVQEQIQGLGNNLLMVIPGATTAAGVRSGWGGESTLTVQDAEAIERDCDAVAAVAHVRRQIVQIIYGNENWSTMAQGSTPSYERVSETPVVAGRFLDERDERSAARVLVLGQTIVEKLFGEGEDPIGAVVRIAQVPFRVVGVLKEKGQTSWGRDQDDVIVMPFSTAERRVMGATQAGRVDFILASARTQASVDEAADQIDALLRERHRTRPGEEPDFSVRNLKEIAERAQKTTRVMTTVLLAVSSISLLVGGIGIMNILLVSVTERTREIGIRMAVGAKARHILLQFLVESIVLSMIGGFAGVLLGLTATQALSQIGDWPALVSPVVIVGAVLFAGTVGVFFGFYPARKASRLEPIAALRYE